jgi:hypothetical protein
LKNKSLKNQKSSIDFFIETPKPSLVERLSDYLKGRGDSVKVIRTLLLLGALLGISALTLQSSMAMAKKGHPSPTPTPTSILHGAPTLLSPANGAFVSANPTLVWRAVSGAARYHLQVGSGTSFDEQANAIEY